MVNKGGQCHLFTVYLFFKRGLLPSPHIQPSHLVKKISIFFNLTCLYFPFLQIYLLYVCRGLKRRGMASAGGISWLLHLLRIFLKFYCKKNKRIPSNEKDDKAFYQNWKGSGHCTLFSIHCLPFLSNIEDKIQRKTRLIKTAPSGKWKALVSENRVESKDFSLSASFPPSSTSFTQWLAPNTPRDQKKWVKRSDKNLLLSLEIFPMCTSSEPKLGKSW